MVGRHNSPTKFPMGPGVTHTHIHTLTTRKIPMFYHPTLQVKEIPRDQKIYRGLLVCGKD